MPKLQIRKGASCDYHRIKLPYEHLDYKAKTPIYIYNRQHCGIPGFIKKIRELGFKVICDLDDFWQVDKTHYLYESFKQRDYAKSVIENIREADAVTVTTSIIADKAKAFNKNVIVIPNALPFDTGQFTRSKDKESGTPFIYVGGASHRPDLTLIKDVCKGLTIAGYQFDPEWFYIKQICADALYKDEYPLDSYMHAYEGHRVAIAPLVDTFFNSCKSNLKVLEAGAKGLPIITSRCLPYYNPIDKDVVMYADTKEEWLSHMHKLTTNPAYAEDMGEALALHVRQHYSLDKVNVIRRQLLESLG